jgi:hypothetical protein
LTQQRVAQAEAGVRAKGLAVTEEEQIFRPRGVKHGTKGSRFADVTGVDPVTGEIKEVINVGRVTQQGLPIARERRALEDIRESEEFLDKARNAALRFIDKITGRSF